MLADQIPKGLEPEFPSTHPQVTRPGCLSAIARCTSSPVGGVVGFGEVDAIGKDYGYGPISTKQKGPVLSLVQSEKMGMDK